MYFPIDLKSDTVTKPSEEMRRAMYEAEVGDDVYSEDPTVLRLEEKAAEITGKEAALFAVSGTMGNLVSLLSHCNRGDGVIIGTYSHINNYEGGGLSALGGLFPILVDDSSGIPSQESIGEKCLPKNVHYAPARLLCLENTHNKCGGIAVSPERFAETGEKAKDMGLPVHLDGARLFNAALAWGADISVYTSRVDSVQLCLSKGLGAPVGSVICASSDFIDRARHWRKRVGGGMRQAGVIASAGLYALDHNIDRMIEDHENAKRIAYILQDGGLAVEENGRQTNMVFFSIPENGPTASMLIDSCARRGVYFTAMGERRVRLVTHLDVSKEQAVKAAEIIVEEAKKPE
ncbi:MULTISPECIES: low-specificity L-threonine aldolase [Aminobacterium]|jgi:threonine aldolase|uniref:low-specificity L-threonine aldolase n=1 Tax=Aminobacterium TaxID=81466 RepID=UPI00257BB207|nr:low-specificity L-threonine aldolase [Aminobacterium sp. UBA4987]